MLLGTCTCHGPVGPRVLGTGLPRWSTGQLQEGRPYGILLPTSGFELCSAPPDEAAGHPVRASCYHSTRGTSLCSSGNFLFGALAAPERGPKAGLPVLDSRGPVVLAAWPELKARPHASRGLDALPACLSTLPRSRGGEWNRAAHPSEDPHP